MYRHPSLRPLSREHHFTLCFAKRLMALERVDSELLEARWPEIRERLGRFWQDSLQIHFRVEESHIPWQCLERASYERLVGEHCEIRDLFEHLKEAGQPDGFVLGRLGRLLMQHIRWEEHVLFPPMQEQSGEALAAIEHASEELQGADPAWLLPVPGRSAAKTIVE